MIADQKGRPAGQQPPAAPGLALNCFDGPSRPDQAPKASEAVSRAGPNPGAQVAPALLRAARRCAARPSVAAAWSRARRTRRPWPYRPVPRRRQGGPSKVAGGAGTTLAVCAPDSPGKWRRIGDHLRLSSRSHGHLRDWPGEPESSRADTQGASGDLRHGVSSCLAAKTSRLLARGECLKRKAQLRRLGPRGGRVAVNSAHASRWDLPRHTALP